MLYWGLINELKRAIIALPALDSFTEYISFLYKVSHELKALRRPYTGTFYPIVITVPDRIVGDQMEWEPTAVSAVAAQFQ